MKKKLVKRAERLKRELAVCDLRWFRLYAERDWLGAFGAWLFADLNLPILEPADPHSEALAALGRPR